MNETPETLSNILKQFIIEYNRTFAYPTQTTAIPIYGDMDEYSIRNSDEQLFPVTKVKITGSYLQGNHNNRENFEYERDLLYPNNIKGIDIYKASGNRFYNLNNLLNLCHPNLVTKVVTNRLNGQVDYIEVYFSEPSIEVSKIYTYFKKYSAIAGDIPEIVKMDSVKESYKKDKVFNEGKNWLSNDDIILYNKINGCTYVPF